MIPQKELRIGNWVVDSKGASMSLSSGAQVDEFESYSPIPMSDDLLVRCGFTYQEHFKIWQKEKPAPQGGFEMQMNTDYEVCDFGKRSLGVQLTSLHQLQNLFFMLIGKDISIPNMGSSTNHDANWTSGSKFSQRS